jgi:hypothetical protein
MAHRYWPEGDAVGQRIKGQHPRGANHDGVMVVGVVNNMRRNGLERQSIPHVFEWYKQSGDMPQDLVALATGDPQVLAGALHRVICGVSRTAIVSAVTTLEDQLATHLLPRRFQIWLLTLFSFVAMLLVGVGTSGVMHHSVVQRTHEMGVRVALGARRDDLLKLIVGQGFKLACRGVGAGIPIAVVLTRLLSSLLYGVKPTDPLTSVAASLIVTSVALRASYLPARRSAKVDAMVALRYE